MIDLTLGRPDRNNATVGAKNNDQWASERRRICGKRYKGPTVQASNGDEGGLVVRAQSAGGV